MKAQLVNNGACSTCGRPLNWKGDCLTCLVLIGLDEPTAEAAPLSTSLGYGDFEIARRADGSFWELGHGAMGVTYRATDKVLHRSVALKVIDVPAAAGGSEAVRERFLREARAAAALRHPNVAGVFQFGAAPEINRCYYAMELVEGETLEARVRREGPLRVELALEIAIQVNRALVAAAAHNLIHRDLKPANIMLTPNESGSGKLEVKVIDFGLAKVTAEAANEKDITHGGFVGTPAFASPEQFDSQPADARSDIYSLGVTLWYALTGRAPFSGSTIEELRDPQTHAVLPIEELRAQKIPPPVISLLRSALSIEPARRPQSARELSVALDRCRKTIVARSRRPKRLLLTALAAGVLIVCAAGVTSYLRLRVTPPEKSIAVLPFQNLSDDKDSLVFAAGIQDDVLTSVAQIHDLKVISRTSVMAYQKPDGRNMRAIGRALGVANVLEGSVRHAGNRVLVNVQLIDARNDRHLWAERYDRTVVDALGLQGELATQIAAALKATLAPEEKARLDVKPTANSEAYVLYLTALGEKNSLEGWFAAEQLFVQATTLDPKFALAYARASVLNSKIASSEQPRARKAKARAQAVEALHLAPTLGEAHMALGVCLYWGEKKYEAALQEFNLAAAASPNNAEIYTYIGGIYRRQGRWRDAVASFDRAVSLDPRNAQVAFRAANNHLNMRNWVAAAGDFTRAVEIEPNAILPRIGLAYVEVFRNGHPAAGRNILQTSPAGFQNDGVVVLTRWDMAMLERDYGTAEKALSDYIVKDAWSGSPKALFQGRIALARGDIESAQRYFAAAASALEGWVREDPDDPERHGRLGLLYAYMGRKEDAIRESRRAVELDPESQDAFHGALEQANLALVYALVGEPDQAIPLIERLLSTPGAVDGVAFPANITLAELRLRWEWDSLRSNPRFQKILAAPEPGTVLTATH
ncbi:MAG: protein kinase domain-containing protein [Chthoniobacterales bacterium]